MTRFFSLFALLIVGKFLLNLSKYLCAKRLRKKYELSFTTENLNFSLYIPQLKKLLVDADLSERRICATERLAGGSYAAMNVKIVDNLSSRRNDVVGSTIPLLDELVAVFRMRMFESVSVRYWIECLVYLPRNAVQFVGGNSDGVAAKLLQIIYWLLVPLFLFVRANAYEYVAAFFEQAKNIF